MLDSIVHVFDESAGVCRPAIVLSTPDAVGGLRLRVLYPTSLGFETGANDVEAVYPPAGSAPVYGAGTTHERRADSWHAVERSWRG